MKGRRLPQIAALCALAAGASPLTGGTTTDRPQPADNGFDVEKVLHLRVRGDLDSTALAADFGRTLREAAAEGTGLVVLELDGNRWRTDVVWSMAYAIREAGLRTVVLLADRSDGVVGAGHAALGLVAGACHIDDRTEIRAEPGDADRRLAPPDTDWERVDRELQGVLWVAATDRQADTDLVRLLLSPSQPTWEVLARNAAGRTTLTVSRPAPTDQVRPVAVPTGEHDRVRVVIEAEQALRLGIAVAPASGAGQALAAERIRARPLERRELSSRIEAARRDLRATFERLGVATDLATARLADARSLRGDDAEAQQRRIASEVLSLLDEAEGHLARLEALTVEHGELLREVPPTRTPVAQETDDMPRLWRTEFQSRRDDIERLRSRARQMVF